MHFSFAFTIIFVHAYFSYAFNIEFMIVLLIFAFLKVSFHFLKLIFKLVPAFRGQPNVLASNVLTFACCIAWSSIMGSTRRSDVWLVKVKVKFM